MNRFLVFLLFALPLSAISQITWHDAASLPIYGKATEQTLTRYERLPTSLENNIRQHLWDLGRNSAGLALRFRSNSTGIHVKWETRNNLRMNHMTPTGICGLDLYILQDDNTWAFAGNGRPDAKFTEAAIVKNMTPEEREFMLYLPLYDGPISLEIGVDSLATLEQPKVDLPVKKGPIVFYGTSIMQGGCANRPGMCHTNILQRWLNRECINLGFSGNARLDTEIAEVIGRVENPSLIVLDFVPNCTAEEIRKLAEDFYTIVRTKHPNTPILFVENPLFPHMKFDQESYKDVTSRNEALAEFFAQLKARNEQRIYYLPARDIVGNDGEASVDGVHLTDLGYYRFAKVMLPICEMLIGK